MTAQKWSSVQSPSSLSVCNGHEFFWRSFASKSRSLSRSETVLRGGAVLPCEAFALDCAVEGWAEEMKLLEAENLNLEEATLVMVLGKRRRLL